jgi:hypothetical protein
MSESFNDPLAVRCIQSLGHFDGEIEKTLEFYRLAIDIANTQKIEAVIVNGRLFDRTGLDSLLAGAENAVKNK